MKKVIRMIIVGNQYGDYFGHENDRHPVGELLQCLEHATGGAIKLHSPNGDRVEKYVVDIYPPKGVNESAWAEMESERLQSFGYNAVPAPEWKA
jgi:hypothetical protein